MNIDSQIEVFPALNDVKANENILNLYDFVMKNVDENTTSSEMAALVKNNYYENFIQNKIINLESFKQSLNNFNFYDNNNYINEDNSDIYVFQSTLYNFKKAIINFINTRDLPAKEPFYFTIPSSPRLEAFVKVGNNKLDIRPTNKDYGLLFQ